MKRRDRADKKTTKTLTTVLVLKITNKIELASSFAL